MLRLLALGNGLKVVVKTVSKEFGVPEKTVYSDHDRMAFWVHVLHQDKQLGSLVRERLDLLNREMLVLMLEIESSDGKKPSVKERFLKVNAALAALKVVQEQIKLGQNLGLIKQAPITVQNSSITTPFEADPLLRQALLKSIAEQKAEKEAQDKQRETEGREGNGDSAQSADASGA